MTEYFVRAIGAVRASKEKYAEAEARALRPIRPLWFSVSFDAFSAGVADGEE